REDEVKGLRPGIEKPAARGGTGRVDENVDRTDLRHRGTNRSRRRGNLGQVLGERVDLGAAFPQAVGDRGKLLRLAVDQKEAADAFPGKTLGDGLAHPLRSAGNDG